MNDYKDIKFTIKARHGDRAKIAEAIQERYPEATIEFIDADVEIPTASVEIADGNHLTGMREEISPGQFRDISGDVLISSVNSLLLSLFVDRVS